MKNLLILLAILPFMTSCNNPKKVKTDGRLLGAWKMPMIDNDTKKVIDTLNVLFTDNGVVSYSSKGPFTYSDGTTKDYHIWKEKYYLTDKKTIVTINENSEKSEAKYKFLSDEKLQLVYENNTQTLTKIK